MDVRFQHPFNCIVGAPTKSGKTMLVKKIVEFSQEIITPPPQEIYWFYDQWQPAYQQLLQFQPSITFIEGFPKIDEMKINKEIPKLLILDDMMESAREKNLTHLFTIGSHHLNLSIIHIVQNMFFNGTRTSRINAQYLILLKNPADKLQVQNLGRQLFPGSQYFLEAYEDATKVAYGYLLIDLTQNTPENFRLRTNIFPSDDVMYVYTRK